MLASFPRTCGEGGKDSSFNCAPSLSEDDDELTESKIRAFLDEKVLFLALVHSDSFKFGLTYCFDNEVLTNSSGFGTKKAAVTII